MALQKMNWLRFCAALLAVVVGLHSLWLLAVGLARPQLPFFPTDKQTAATLAAAQGGARFAATLGLMRSDLWTDYALTLAANPDLKSAASAINANPAVIATAERAVAIGPHDARPWLLLADVHAHLDGLNRTIFGPLKMSYYTAPNETALIPLRLSLATETEATIDPEIQNLATNDLRTILLHQPEMRPAIIAAYQGASANGKHFVESAVAQLDPSFSPQLQSAAAPPQ